MKRKAGRLLLIAGCVFVLAAAALVLFNVWDSRRAAEVSEQVLGDLRTEMLQRGVVIRTAAVEPAQAPDMIEPALPAEKEEPVGQAESTEEAAEEAAEESTEEPAEDMPTIQIDEREYVGILELPSLELSLPIMADWDYSRLQISPCRYSGSAEQGDLVICGHNYLFQFDMIRYIAVGADVYFTNVEGLRYHYRVSATEVLKPVQVEEMIHSDSGWDMTFFTCNMDRSTRFAVRCAFVGTPGEPSSAEMP